MRSTPVATIAIAVALLVGGCVTTAKEGPGSTLTSAEQPLTGVAGSGSESYLATAGTTTHYSVNIAGALSSMSVERTDARTMVRSDGRVTKVNDWGIAVSSTEDGRSFVFDPHSGYLPEGPMKVGMSWTTRYHAAAPNEDRWWTRTCKIPSRGEITAEAGPFKDAWLVMCSAQQDGGKLRVEDKTWWSSRGRISLNNERQRYFEDKKSSNSFTIKRLDTADKSLIVGSTIP